MKRTIESQLAQECAEALVKVYNESYVKLAPSCRLISFWHLCSNLKELNCAWLIAGATHPTDWPQEVWFEESLDSAVFKQAVTEYLQSKSL